MDTNTNAGGTVQNDNGMPNDVDIRSSGNHFRFVNDSGFSEMLENDDEVSRTGGLDDDDENVADCYSVDALVHEDNPVVSEVASSGDLEDDENAADSHSTNGLVHEDSQNVTEGASEGDVEDEDRFQKREEPDTLEFTRPPHVTAHEAQNLHFQTNDRRGKFVRVVDRAKIMLILTYYFLQIFVRIMPKIIDAACLGFGGEAFPTPKRILSWIATHVLMTILVPSFILTGIAILFMLVAYTIVIETD